MCAYGEATALLLRLEHPSASAAAVGRCFEEDLLQHWPLAHTRITPENTLLYNIELQIKPETRTRKRTNGCLEAFFCAVCMVFDRREVQTTR